MPSAPAKESAEVDREHLAPDTDDRAGSGIACFNLHGVNCRCIGHRPKASIDPWQFPRHDVGTVRRSASDTSHRRASLASGGIDVTDGPPIVGVKFVLTYLPNADPHQSPNRMPPGFLITIRHRTLCRTGGSNR